MKPLVTRFLFGLSLLNSGCAVFVDGARNLAVSITTPAEQKREWKRNYQLAEDALQAQGEVLHSPDFAAGFKDGYAEFLYRGGSGEPPPVAPRRYRHFNYQTPEGYQAIADWFAGYRRGAAAARASGAREWITGPSSLHAAVPPTARDGAPVVAAHEPTELLPPPRPATLGTPRGIEAEGPVQPRTGVE
jgi:hypothetical protein